MKARFQYFKFYHQDYWDATRLLSPAERGLYMDFIIIMMRGEGPVDDRDDAIAHMMHVSSRLWRSIKIKLIEQKKIFLSDGKLANERCVIELQALLDERQKRSTAASIREAGKQISCPVQPRTSAEPAPNQPRTSAEPAPNQPQTKLENSKKPCNINGTDSTAVPPVTHYARASLDLDLDLDLERESSGAAEAAPCVSGSPAASPAKELTKSVPVLKPMEPPTSNFTYNKLDVVVNCEAIYGPNFTLPFSSIDMNSIAVGIEPAKGRLIIESAARVWAANGTVPINVQSMMIEALKRCADPVKPKRKAPPAKKTKTQSGYTEEFEAWWTLYPRSEAKGDAFRAWENLGMDQRDRALKAVNEQREWLIAQSRKPEGNFCPLPATWLNKKRFDDPPRGSRAASVQPAPRNPLLDRGDWSEDMYETRLRYYLANGKITKAEFESTGLQL